jgi:hypothetical protein
MVLRRLAGPLTLWEEPERPDFMRFETTPTTELLDGLATLEVASPAGTNTSGRPFRRVLRAA